MIFVAEWPAVAIELYRFCWWVLFYFIKSRSVRF